MNNKPVLSENLTSGQIFFKEGLILLVRGNGFSRELIRHSERGKVHHTIVSSAPQKLTNISFDHIFFCPSIGSVFSNVPFYVI